MVEKKNFFEWWLKDSLYSWRRPVVSWRITADDPPTKTGGWADDSSTRSRGWSALALCPAKTQNRSSPPHGTGGMTKRDSANALYISRRLSVIRHRGFSATREDLQRKIGITVSRWVSIGDGDREWGGRAKAASHHRVRFWLDLSTEDATCDTRRDQKETTKNVLQARYTLYRASNLFDSDLLSWRWKKIDATDAIFLLRWTKLG